MGMIFQPDPEDNYLDEKATLKATFRSHSDPEDKPLSLTFDQIDFLIKADSSDLDENGLSKDELLKARNALANSVGGPQNIR